MKFKRNKMEKTANKKGIVNLNKIKYYNIIKKFGLTLAISIVTVFSLTACGSGSNENNEKPETTKTVCTEPPAGTRTPVETNMPEITSTPESIQSGQSENTSGEPMSQNTKTATEVVADIKIGWNLGNTFDSDDADLSEIWLM